MDWLLECKTHSGDRWFSEDGLPMIPALQDPLTEEHIFINWLLSLQVTNTIVCILFFQMTARNFGSTRAKLVRSTIWYNSIIIK